MQQFLFFITTFTYVTAETNYIENSNKKMTGI